MNSGQTAERVYEAVKRRILTRFYRPGERIEPAALASDLSSSVTPVRDALHRLLGEGLVTARTGGGFHLPPLDEPGLSDLYGWQSELLLTAIQAWDPRRHTQRTQPLDRSPPADHANRTADLFDRIASLSANSEHRSATSSLNSRLHAVRLVEVELLGEPSEELETIEAALASADAAVLRRMISVYHRRRRKHAAAIVRAAYRTA